MGGLPRFRESGVNKLVGDWALTDVVRRFCFIHNCVRSFLFPPYHRVCFLPADPSFPDVLVSDGVLVRLGVPCWNGSTRWRDELVNSRVCYGSCCSVFPGLEFARGRPLLPGKKVPFLLVALHVYACIFLCAIVLQNGVAERLGRMGC